MGMAQWMRVLDTVGDLAQLSGKSRPARGDEPVAGVSAPQSGGLEARLAGVLVSALREAFDRDSTRLDMERTQLDAERERAGQALRAELRRQAGERALGQLRLIAVMALSGWALSAVLSVWLPGMRAGVPRVLLGLGWALALATLVSAFSGWQRISTWAAEDRAGPSAPLHAPSAIAAPFLLVASLALTAACLLAGM